MFPGKGSDSEEHERILEEHLLETSLREVQAAAANRFIPLMMVPEAAEFSAQHQTRQAPALTWQTGMIGT